MGNHKLSEFWTTSDVAKQLNRTPDWVRQLDRTGKLPAIRTKSGQRLFRLKDVKRFLSAQAARTRTIELTF